MRYTDNSAAAAAGSVTDSRERHREERVSLERHRLANELRKWTCGWHHLYALAVRLGRPCNKPIEVGSVHRCYFVVLRLHYS